MFNVALDDPDLNAVINIMVDHKKMHKAQGNNLGIHVRIGWVHEGEFKDLNLFFDLLKCEIEEKTCRATAEKLSKFIIETLQLDKKQDAVTFTCDYALMGVRKEMAKLGYGDLEGQFQCCGSHNGVNFFSRASKQLLINLKNKDTNSK